MSSGRGMISLNSSGRDLYHILGIKVKTWSDHVLFLFAQIYIVEFGVNDLGMACKVSLLIDHWHIDPVTIRLESKGFFKIFLFEPVFNWNYAIDLIHGTAWN